MNDLTNQIILKAMEYENVPYIHQGRDKNGIDCVGLIVAVCKELNIGDIKVDRLNYPPEGTGIEVESRIQKAGLLRLPKNSYPLPGNVIGFWIGRSTRIQHLGIMMNNNQFIHTHQGVGKVVFHNLNGSWKHRIGVVWKFPESEIKGK